MNRNVTQEDLSLDAMLTAAGWRHEEQPRNVGLPWNERFPGGRVVYNASGVCLGVLSYEAALSSLRAAVGEV